MTVPEYISSLPSFSGSFHISGIFIGAFLAFYAYTGFEDMVNVAEEVHEPSKNMPKAIIYALITATFLYFLVIYVCLSIVSPDELSESNAPLALVYERVTGRDPLLISAIGSCAVVNGALIQIIMASRILYGLARQKWIPSIFSQVNPVTRTPVVSTVVVTILIIAMAIWFPIVTLAKSTSFLLFTVFSLVNLALLKIKLTEPHPDNIICIPVWVPAFGFLTSTSFILFQVLIETGIL